MRSVTDDDKYAEYSCLTPEVTAYHFDLLGQLDLVVSPNGVVADYDFDDMGRVLSITHFDDYDADLVRDTTIAPEPIIAQFDYTYNDAGQRLSAIENFDTDSDGDFDVTHEFDWDYDALDRLIEEIHVGTGPDSGDDYTTTYSFDLVGNRVEMITDSDDALKDRTVTYSYDDNDRLLTETSNAVTGDDTHTLYSWGNATGTVGGTATQQTGKKVWESLDTSGDVLETVTYAYNLQGRLAQATIVKGSDTTVLTYNYDDSGIRVGQTETVNAGTPIVTQYLVDHNNHTGYQQVLEEFVDAVLVKSYTIGLDVLAQTNAGTTPDTYQFLYDAHGSTRALLDTLAIIAQTYAYDAYGNALGFDASAALTSLLYSGEQFDQKLALQYLRARYYDAGTGRFNRVDPYRGSNSHPQTFHKYSYGLGNPQYYTDPSGLIPSLLERLVLAATNAIVLGITTAPTVSFVATKVAFIGLGAAIISAAYEGLEDLGWVPETSLNNRVAGIGLLVFAAGTMIAEFTQAVSLLNPDRISRSHGLQRGHLSDLRRVQLAARAALPEGRNGHRNAATIEWYDPRSGVYKTRTMISDGPDDHSERRLIQSLEEDGIDLYLVTRIYSDRKPCTHPAPMHGDSCEELLEKRVPQATITWGYDYESKNYNLNKISTAELQSEIDLYIGRAVTSSLKSLPR